MKTKERGTTVPVPDVWVQEVQAAMEKEGLSQARLARRARISPSVVSRIFKVRRAGARAVLEISRVLDLRAPAVQDESMAEVLAIAQRLRAISPEVYKTQIDYMALVLRTCQYEKSIKDSKRNP